MTAEEPHSVPPRRGEATASEGRGGAAKDGGAPSSIAEVVRAAMARFPALAWGVAPVRQEWIAGHARGLGAWLDRGLHGEMSWLAASRDVRSDPRRLWPWCRSVLVVRMPYALPAPEEKGVRPQVAGYARRRDYHVVLRELLIAAGRDMAGRLPGLEFRAFVDSLPLPEVELAVQAGLGWRGKNSLLLARGAGSAFHLGGLLLSVDWTESVSPARDFCGGCRACLDACPTGALLEPGLIDAGRCISHWTIEERRPGPGPVAQALRDEIFGCDICQQACPWNHKLLVPRAQGALPIGMDLPAGTARRARDGSPVAACAPAGTAAEGACAAPPESEDGCVWPIEWEEWIALCLPESGFQRTFRKTPLDRAGRARILCSLLQALWNVDRARGLPLMRLARSREAPGWLRDWIDARLVETDAGATD